MNPPDAAAADRGDDQCQTLNQIAKALRHSVIVDVETTGLNEQLDRIVEIALLRLEDGMITDRLVQKFNPGCHLPQVIQDLTHLTNAALEDQPGFEERAAEVASFITGRTLVGHNVGFDIGFLNQEFVRAKQEPLAKHGLCTAAASRILIPRERVGRYKLANLAEVLDFRVRPAHRAENDARATFELLKALSQY